VGLLDSFVGVGEGEEPRKPGKFFYAAHSRGRV
jgi:hypothetical protein